MGDAVAVTLAQALNLPLSLDGYSDEPVYVFPFNYRKVQRRLWLSLRHVYSLGFAGWLALT